MLSGSGDVLDPVAEKIKGMFPHFSSGPGRREANLAGRLHIGQVFERHRGSEDCRLAEELSIARADGSFIKRLERLAKVDLLILDDWGLTDLDRRSYSDLLEVLDDRVGRKSTLVTSQLPTKLWHDKVGNPMVADALLDRLLPKAVQIDLKGESMR